MDSAVVAVYFGVATLAILARAGWRRRKARLTPRYLQALRRVHDTNSGAAASAVPSPSVPAGAAPFVPRKKALELLSPPRRHRVRRPSVGTKAVGIGAAALTACALAGLGVALADRSSPSPSHLRTRAPVTQSAGHKVKGTPTKGESPPAPHAAPLVIAGVSGSGNAAYTVTSGPVQLALVVSTRCWVEMRASSVTGPVLYEGVLGPGAERAFENAGGLWFRLGYPPGVAVQVDGKPVGLPASAAPLDITVDSATATST